VTQRPLIQTTAEGLYCPAGDFHIDPWRPVERAVTTHAHADHARTGSAAYLCTAPGQHVLRPRLGPEAVIETLPYRESKRIGDVTVSFHPAGHLLGSAQVRIERGGEVWVVSGDYKTVSDATCDRFEPVPCDVFITESTFGLPVYRWPDQRLVFEEIDTWWRANRKDGRTSLLFVYALGKAQRVLSGIDTDAGPLAAHGAVRVCTDAYIEAGVALPALPALDDLAPEDLGRSLVLAPPSAQGSPWMRRFRQPATGFVSGWMLLRGPRRRRSVERGFVLSDHADWPGLLDAVAATGAERIGVTHGSADAMARWLREQGRESWTLPTRFEGESEQAGIGSPE